MRYHVGQRVTLFYGCQSIFGTIEYIDYVDGGPVLKTRNRYGIKLDDGRGTRTFTAHELYEAHCLGVALYSIKHYAEWVNMTTGTTPYFEVRDQYPAYRERCVRNAIKGLN